MYLRAIIDIPHLRRIYTFVQVYMDLTEGHDGTLQPNKQSRIL